MGSHEQSFDVVVVGCGIAGLSAAVAAQQRGARVGVLERAPIEERGGNTRHTPARLRMKSMTEVTDDFFDYFANNAGGHLDPSLIRHTSRDVENWPGILRSLGFADSFCATRRVTASVPPPGTQGTMRRIALLG